MKETLGNGCRLDAGIRKGEKSSKPWEWSLDEDPPGQLFIWPLTVSGSCH